MAGWSDYLENKFLLWVKGTDMPTAPAAVYVALYDGDPTDAGSGGTDKTTVIRGAGRVAATFGSVSGDPKQIANSAAVDFGPADGAVSNLSHFAIWDASTSGNMIASGALAPAVAIAAAQPVKFEIGALVLKADTN